MNNLLTRLDKYKDRYLGSFIILTIDCFASFFASLCVIFMLRLWINPSIVSLGYSLWWLGLGLIASALFFYILRIPRIVIRHMSIKEMATIILAAFGKTITVAVLSWLIYDSIAFMFLLFVGFIDGLLTFGIMLVIRIAMVVTYDWVRSNKPSDKRLNVLICGTGDKSVALVTRLVNSPNYNVIGFLKSKKEFVHQYVAGKEVRYYSGAESLQYFKRHYQLDALLIPSEKYLQKYSNNIIEDASKSGVKILVAPSIDEVHDGVVLHNHIREIRIEDLLGRDEINISMGVITEYFKDKVIMVTGAAGSIGSELCRQLATFGIRRLILFDNAETPMHYLRLELDERFPYLDYIPVIGDVRSIERLDFAFRHYRPQVVFHAAAYKHVPLMEENPCEAVRVNVIGTKQVADKCIEYGIERMVMVSTDKAVNPTNIMGCSKRLAEIYVQSLSEEHKGKTQFVTTRFGNVLGSNGSVIPRFREQIAKGGPITVTHPDITRFFMTIPEACRLVMEAATFSKDNQIFVFDMGEPVKIDTLARNMVTLAGLKPGVDIEIKYTGLRPGEKLYEEVLSNAENTIPTSHSRIRIATVRKYKYDDANQYVSKLEELSTNVKIDEMVRLMKVIVPEYISNNSRFSEFDTPVQN